MKKRVGSTVCFLLAVCIASAAQEQPTLAALNMPRYPRLALQARVQGKVKAAFTLQPHSGEPTNVNLVSAEGTVGTGVEILTESALANVKTWRFDNSASAEATYETTFEFRFSTGKGVVSFESFHSVTVVAGEADFPTIDQLRLQQRCLIE